MTVEIRRSSARFVDRVPGRITHHAFAFGQHYDPEHLGFGPMVCHDDHLLGSGQGFDTHRHSDLEIITWVVSGALTHTGSSGQATTVEAGSAAVLSAGSGTDHAEHATTTGPARFVQVWLTPDDVGTAPSYDVAAVPVGSNVLVPVAAADGSAPLRVATGSAAFSVARLDAGATLALPDAEGLHVFVATGALARSSLAEPLSAGDAFLIRDARGVSVTAAVPTELLVWTFADLRESRTGESGAAWAAAERTSAAGGGAGAGAGGGAGGAGEIAGTALRLTGAGGGFPLRGDADGSPLPDDFDFLHARLGLSRDLYDDLVTWGEAWAAAPGLAELHSAAKVLLARLEYECPAYSFALRL